MPRPYLPISFSKKTSIKARALFLGERIDLKSLEGVDKLSTLPLTINVKDCGIAVLFRYGVVVLFDIPALEEATFISQLEPLISQKHKRPESETLEIQIDAEGHERMENNAIYLERTTLDRFQVIADIMAKSVVLDYFEATLEKSFDQIEPMAANLEKSGHVGRSSSDILRHIGNTLMSEHKMISRVRLMEKPDVLWERPQLERLYIRLENEFEIRERSLAQERKLQLIARTAQTILELNQNHHAMRVEWYIVILIIIEVVLELIKFFTPNLIK